MSITGKLVIAVAIGVLASIIATLLQGGSIPDILLAILFIAATSATALATHRPLAPATVGAAPVSGSEPAASKKSGTAAKTKTKPTKTSSGPRETGSVKWFNAAKGFGFLVLDDEREIFVHFRSIRGDGRRSLRDGQRVEFTVANTDKGPQAEDVEPLD